MKSKLLLFLLIPMLGIAQNRAAVKGRVIADNRGVKKAQVLNEGSREETFTDSLGYFTIKANNGDMLIVLDNKTKPVRVQYSKDAGTNGLFVITTDMVVTELEEVIINKDKKLSAEGLGLIEKGKAKYTTAERKYEAQGKVKVIFDSLNPGLSLQTDGFINRITGKRKNLLKGLETERKEGIIKNLNNIYTQDEIMQQYKIPTDYVNGFMFFVAEDGDIAGAIASKNDLVLKSRLNELALVYLDILNNKQ